MFTAEVDKIVLNPIVRCSFHMHLSEVNSVKLVNIIDWNLFSQPLRAVVDGQLQTPHDARIYTDGGRTVVHF